MPDVHCRVENRLDITLGLDSLRLRDPEGCVLRGGADNGRRWNRHELHSRHHGCWELSSYSLSEEGRIICLCFAVKETKG